MARVVLVPHSSILGHCLLAYTHGIFCISIYLSIYPSWDTVSWHTHMAFSGYLSLILSICLVIHFKALDIGILTYLFYIHLSICIVIYVYFVCKFNDYIFTLECLFIQPLQEQFAVNHLYFIIGNHVGVQ